MNIRSPKTLLFARILSKGIRTLSFLLLALMTSLSVNMLMAATSVSQYGITWRWQEDRQVGQYANGDWWVVGPVTITSITPASVTDVNGWTKNGTVVNPNADNGQGFDSSMNGYLGIFYSASRNVAPSVNGSLNVTTGSVVSSVSRDTPGGPGTRPQITDAAVLTVVSTAPATGAFRPPLVGSDKTSRWNKNQLNYGILRSLPPVVRTPALSTVENYFARPWFAQMDGSPARYISPLNNMPEYGRDQAHQVSDAMLSLHLNYTNSQKERLFVLLVQYGIDIFGAVKAGKEYPDLGGLNVGRKAPLVFAAVALNDADMVWHANAANKFVFHDDRQHWFVKQEDVGRTLHTADGRIREEYRQEHVGLPEWGEQHTRQPSRDGSNWTVMYRHTNGGPLAGQILAIRLTQGGEAAWNWPAVFAYIDRYWSIERANGYDGQRLSFPNRIGPFAFNMWTAYRGSGNTALPATPPTGGPPKTVGFQHSDTFTIGQRIRTISTVQVHELSALNSKVIQTMAPESIGTVIDSGSGDNLFWYKVKFVNGTEGWCKVSKQILHILVDGSNVDRAINDFGVNFTKGDRVRVAQPADVRTNHIPSALLLGTQPIRAEGEIIEFEEKGDETTWARVRFDDGMEGWCMVGVRRTMVHHTEE